jgi:hypothetical protein
MPAPKKFNPGPTTSPSYTTGYGSSSSKGRHNVVSPPPKPAVDDDESVEVAVEEVTVVMRDVSKYERRALNAHVEPSISIEIDEVDEAPAPVEPIVFGEWRTESSLDGTHYHRKDSRRT